MKERIRQILEENLPLADIDSQFLFAELSSLDITTIMMMLSEEYNISLDSKDVTSKNFMNVDSITALVERKLKG
jgi:acyl carrier protein